MVCMSCSMSPVRLSPRLNSVWRLGAVIVLSQSLHSRDVGGFSCFSVFPMFDPFFLSLSSFCFLKHAEVLWELFISWSWHLTFCVCWLFDHVWCIHTEVQFLFVAFSYIAIGAPTVPFVNDLWTIFVLVSFCWQIWRRRRPIFCSFCRAKLWCALHPLGMAFIVHLSPWDGRTWFCGSGTSSLSIFSITVLIEELSSSSELLCIFRFYKSLYRFLMILSSLCESDISHVKLNICSNVGL